MSGESPDMSDRDRERQSSEKTPEGARRVPEDAEIPGDSRKGVREAASAGAADQATAVLHLPPRDEAQRKASAAGEAPANAGGEPGTDGKPQAGPAPSGAAGAPGGGDRDGRAAEDERPRRSTKAEESGEAEKGGKTGKAATADKSDEERATEEGRGAVDQPTTVLQLPSESAQSTAARSAGTRSAAGRAPAGRAPEARRGSATASRAEQPGDDAQSGDEQPRAAKPRAEGEPARPGKPGREAAGSAAGEAAGTRAGERSSAADRPAVQDGPGEPGTEPREAAAPQRGGTPADEPRPDAARPEADRPEGKKRDKAPDSASGSTSDKASGSASDKASGTAQAEAPGKDRGKPAGERPGAGQAARDVPTRVIAPAKSPRAGNAAAPGGESAAPEREERPVDQPTTALRLPGSKGGRAEAPPAPSQRPAPALKPLVTAEEQAARQRPPVAAPPKPTAPPPPADADRDPLELLAALTNRPAPPPTFLRSLLRRVKIWTPLVVLLLLIAGVIQLLRPLPDPGLHLTAAESYTFEGETPQVPWPGSGQAALDVVGVGTFGTAGEQEPVPIASVAKVMTAYVILRDHPVEEGSDGAEIPVDARAEADAGLSEDHESTVDVREGETISEREALEAILIASANNVARLLARWDTGSDSEEEFVEKMNETARELGMEHTTYTDPSGLDETTVSTAADQTILARAAMEDPLFREIVRMPSYVDSHGEQHVNWNGLVPVNNVVGIKTGTTTAAGGCLMFAARQDVADESQLIVGVVLGQPPAEADNSILSEALRVSDILIRFAQDQLRAENVLSAGDVVGYVDDGLGGHTPVVVTEDVPAVGWNGLRVTIELAESADGLPRSAEAGTEVGTLSVAGIEVPVALAEDLAEPGFGDRLTRLG